MVTVIINIITKLIVVLVVVNKVTYLICLPSLLFEVFCWRCPWAPAVIGLKSNEDFAKLSTSITSFSWDITLLCRNIQASLASTKLSRIVSQLGDSPYSSLSNRLPPWAKQVEVLVRVISCSVSFFPLALSVPVFFLLPFWPPNLLLHNFGFSSSRNWC